jgi:TPR repeat protein/serine/threonine protein kinase
MNFTVHCPNPGCAALCSVGDDLLGRKVRCARCQRPFALSSDSAEVPAAPATIDKYQVRSRLGEGTYGTVYKARDPDLDRDVAVKVLKPEALASPQALERFKREAKAAANLHHNHIVPVFQFGRHGKGYFLASAYIAGQSLDTVIPPGGLEPHRAVALAVQLLDALVYAHRHDVLHRDVKPANALLDDEGSLYLTDFGLAGSLCDEGPRLTADGAVMGTPAYMAPEQAKGDIQHVGPAADQYSAGVVLYHMLTGTLPFDGTIALVVYHVVHTTPQPPSARRPGLDPELDALVLKALTKEPEGRYRDCAEFAAVLRTWYHAHPPSSGVPLAPAPEAPEVEVTAPTTADVEMRTGDTLPPARGSTPPPLPPAVRSGPKPPAKPASTPPPPVSPAWAATASFTEKQPQPPRKLKPRPPESVTTPTAPSAAGVSRWPILAVIVLTLLPLAYGGWVLLRPFLTAKPPAPQVANNEDGPTPVPHPPPPPQPDTDATVKADIAVVDQLLKVNKPDDDFIKENGPKRLDEWKRVADKGLPGARYLTGRCLELGVGGDKNEKGAAALYEKAAEQDHMGAQFALGRCYEHGIGVEAEAAQAVKWYQKAADQGSAAAQYALGLCARDGLLGMDQNLAKARNWLEQAAKGGLAGAQADLAVLLENTLEASPEELKAAGEWYHKAADQGNAVGQCGYGRFLLEGKGGVAANPDAAAALFRKAAEQGNAEAQYQYAGCLAAGLGVQESAEQAIAWYRKAANQEHPDEGHPGAQFELGKAYAEGRGGLQKSPQTAVIWFRRAAERGHVEAMFRLGKAYDFHQGVSRDAVEARKWYAKAAEKGFEAAKAALIDLDRYEREEARKEAERKEAERLLGTWQARNGGKTWTLEFQRDGKLLSRGPDPEGVVSSPVQYIYEFKDGKLTLRLKPGGEAVSWTIKNLTPDTFVLEDEKGQTLEFRKQP